MVASAPRHVPHPRRIRRLRHVGRSPEPTLQLPAVSLALLLSGDLRRFAALLVRPQARLVAWVRPVLTGAADPAVSRSVSLYLLLLPRRVLQGVLGRSHQLRGRRAPEVLPR